MCSAPWSSTEPLRVVMLVWERSIGVLRAPLGSLQVSAGSMSSRTTIPVGSRAVSLWTETHRERHGSAQLPMVLDCGSVPGQTHGLLRDCQWHGMTVRWDETLALVGNCGGQIHRRRGPVPVFIFARHDCVTRTCHLPRPCGPSIHRRQVGQETTKSVCRK